MGMLSDLDRDRLRALQDRWLALPVIVNHVRNHGDDTPIAGPDAPTFADVRRVLLPDWEEWFNDFFV